MTNVSSLDFRQQALVPEALACSILRGEEPPFPDEASEELIRDFISFAKVNGVSALIFERLSARDGSGSWPARVNDRLREGVIVQAAGELVVARELDTLLRQFADAGIDALLIKGTPLAYTIYPRPYLRTRGDTDVLIPESQRQAAHEMLLAAGFRSATPFARNLASYQLSYARIGRAGLELNVDLHWRFAQPQLLSRVLSFRELADSAVSVPALSPHARAPDPTHALMIACLHRVAHITAPYIVDGVPYLEANRLIWLYDIHLLAQGLHDSQWSRLVALAEAKSIRAVFLDALRATSARLGTDIPDRVFERLAAPGPLELSAQYLIPGLWRRWLVDVRSLPSWKQRLELLSELAFPPATHMLKKYETSDRWQLPLLYLRRALGGLPIALGFRRLRR